MQALAILLTLIIVINIQSVAANTTTQYTYSGDICDLANNLKFDGPRANESVHYQVSLGPRIPGSQASQQLQYSIEENLTTLGWTVQYDNHSLLNYTFSNVIASLAPSSEDNVMSQTDISRLIFAAHYDTRSTADKDPDQNRTHLAIDGANDGASGVAALLELGRILPMYERDHEIQLIFFDAEDQGDDYTLGSFAWAQNQSEADIDRTEMLVLLDMIGDSDLHIGKALPGTWEHDLELMKSAAAIGLVDGVLDCNGEVGTDIVDLISPEHYLYVFDDHVQAMRVGIKALDIIDLRYGPDAEEFGGYWHTHEDTVDKVSADSIENVGRWVELSFALGIWTSGETNNEMNDRLDLILRIESIRSYQENMTLKQEHLDSRTIEYNQPAFEVSLLMSIATLLLPPFIFGRKPRD